jgi:hypothetical protein
MGHTYRSLTVCKITLLTAALGGAGGCGAIRAIENAGTTPVPLSVVLQSLEVDLSRTHPVVLSDLHGRENDDGPAKVSIRTALANLQCYDIDPGTGKPNPQLRSRNPLIPVVTGPLQLTVQGQLSQGGTFTVGVPTAVSGAATITRQGQQQIMLPTTLVPLRNLPVFFVGQQFTNIQFNSAVLTSFPPDKKLSDEETAQVNAYIARTLEAMIGLDKVIAYALKQFDGDQDAYCKDRDGGKGAPIFLAIPAAAE